MLRIACNNYQDLSSFSRKYLNGLPLAEGASVAGHYHVRAPEALVSLAIGRLAASVWYEALPQAIETICGPNASGPYHEASRHLYGLMPRAEGVPLPEKSCEEAVLEVGGEGGSISLWMREDMGARCYGCTSYDDAGDFIDEEDPKESVRRERIFSTLNEAVAYFDHYPWWEMHPVQVAPAYRDVVVALLRERGVDSRNSSWSEVLKM